MSEKDWRLQVAARTTPSLPTQAREADAEPGLSRAKTRLGVVVAAVSNRSIFTPKNQFHIKRFLHSIYRESN
jgi:hypothetical protein